MSNLEAGSEYRGSTFLGIRAYFYLIALASYLTAYISEPEIFQSLTIGNWIDAHSSVPNNFIWSFFGKQQNWLDSSWFFNLIISHIETNFHWEGIVIFKLLLSLIFVLSLANLLIKFLSNSFIVGLIVLFASIGILEQRTLEPMFSLIAFFPLYLSLAFNFLNKKNSYFSLCAFIPLSLILANVHFGFLFLALISFFLFLEESNLKDSLILFLLSIFSICINPYGLAIFGQIFHIFSVYLTYYLSLRETGISLYDYSFVSLILIWTMAAILSYSISDIEKFSKSLVLAVVLSIFSFAFKHVLPWAIIFTSFLLAKLFNQIIREDKKIDFLEFFFHMDRQVYKLSKFGVVWLMSCIAFVNIYNLIKIPVFTALLPEREMDFILSKKLEFPLWHQSNVSPYVIYRLANEKGEPHSLAMLDNFSVISNPELFRDESLQMWRKTFLENPPKTVLVSHNSPLYDALISDPKWKLVWQNDKEVSSQAEVEKEKIPFYAWAIFAKN